MEDENRPEFIAMCDELTAKRKVLINTIRNLIEHRKDFATKVKALIKDDEERNKIIISSLRSEIASINGKISGEIRSYSADIIDIITDYMLDKHDIPRDILSRFSIARLQEIVFGKSLAKGRLQKKFGGGDATAQRAETDAFRYEIQPAKERQNFKNGRLIIRPKSRLMTTQPTWTRMAEMFYRTSKLYGHHEPVDVLEIEQNGKRFIGSGEKILKRRESKIKRKHELINEKEIRKLEAMQRAESIRN